MQPTMRTPALGASIQSQFAPLTCGRPSLQTCRVVSDAVHAWDWPRMAPRGCGGSLSLCGCRSLQGAGRGRGPPKRSDYLDYDWDGPIGSVDDLTDVKNKYDDFIRLEKTPAYMPGYATQNYNYNRRGSRSFSQPRMFPDNYGLDFDDEWEDEFEDPAPPPPRETEKRYLNGKHVLTNMEIT
jgi:hypothetical protein